eukprot:scaffold127523_cov27-Tisochrysis_lutea.AAC.2
MTRARERKNTKQRRSGVMKPSCSRTIMHATSSLHPTNAKHTLDSFATTHNARRKSSSPARSCCAKSQGCAGYGSDDLCGERPTRRTFTQGDTRGAVIRMQAKLELLWHIGVRLPHFPHLTK